MRHFEDVVRQRIARRGFLKGAGAGGAAALVIGRAAMGNAHSRGGRGRRVFEAITPTNVDEVVVPERYGHKVLIRWGDPLSGNLKPFDVNAQTAARQRQQFGYNCDFVAQLPLPSWFEKGLDHGQRPSRFLAWLLGGRYRQLRTRPSPRALLWVNHEYTTGIDMFPGYAPAAPTAAQVDIEIAAHGGSLILIVEDEHGWEYAKGSPFNRRVTGDSPIALSGPVAGHPLVQTKADPTGRTVLGTLNNCGGGLTPWGTILVAEENFDQYFANGTALAAADPAKARLYARLPPLPGATTRLWEKFHPRFDVTKEPNEFARFGYVVEIDPYDPGFQPRKRTALGRFKHEAAVTALAKDDRVAVYSGDDQRFEYVYKFVSRRRFQAWDREANLDLLDEGTLYAARFLPDGTGRWLPLVHGQGPLTAAAGWPGQAEILIDPRAAGDAVGATRMDRPEDIEVSPVTGKVYIACTNNDRRLTRVPDAGEVAANPRLDNKWGHVIELHEDRDDAGALSFRWEIFLLCGDPDPALEQVTYFAGFDPSQVSPLSCPDNLDFDQAGNLWIATDGATFTPGFAARNDGIFMVPTEGPDRGHVRQFLSGPKGCEVASLKLSTDDCSIFATIQHPGESGGLPNRISTWPDGTASAPRPSVVSAKHRSGAKIGS